MAVELNDTHCYAIFNVMKQELLPEVIDGGLMAAVDVMKKQPVGNVLVRIQPLLVREAKQVRNETDRETVTISRQEEEVEIPQEKIESVSSVLDELRNL